MTNHPITPPLELVDQWNSQAPEGCVSHMRKLWIPTQAAQWGADQELEACCDWFVRDWTDIETADKLRAARRPKPPSLKEQALHELNDVYNRDKIDDTTYDTIRRALEALDD